MPELRDHLSQAAVVANVLQERPQQRKPGHDEHDDDDRPQHPLDAVALDRDEHIAFDHRAENEAEDERRARPLEVLHRPAEHAEKHQREHVAPVPRCLERADIDQAEHDGHEQRVAQRRQLSRAGR